MAYEQIPSQDTLKPPHLRNAERVWRKVESPTQNAADHDARSQAFIDFYQMEIVSEETGKKDIDSESFRKLLSLQREQLQERLSNPHYAYRGLYGEISRDRIADLYDRDRAEVEAIDFSHAQDYLYLHDKKLDGEIEKDEKDIEQLRRDNPDWAMVLERRANDYKTGKAYVERLARKAREKFPGEGDKIFENYINQTLEAINTNSDGFPAAKDIFKAKYDVEKLLELGKFLLAFRSDNRGLEILKRIGALDDPHQKESILLGLKALKGISISDERYDELVDMFSSVSSSMLP